MKNAVRLTSLLFALAFAATTVFAQQPPWIYQRGLGDDQMYKKNYAEAVKNYTQCISNNKDADDCYSKRGRAYQELGKTSEAKADYETAIKLNPKNQQAIDGLAKLKGVTSSNSNAGTASSGDNAGNSTGCVSGNCINGFGKYVFSTGDIYEGNWVNNKMDGQGTLTYRDGDIYTGQYTAGKKSGKGKYIFANGNIYEGNWVNGKREGQGTLTFKIGEVYIGEWKNDKRDGYRKQFIKSTGKVLVGNWKNDEFIGSTATTAANNKETREKAEKAIQTAKTNNSSAKKSDDDEDSELDRIAREEGITISDEQKRQNEKDAKMMADAFTKNPESLKKVNDALSNIKPTSSADYKMTELIFRKQDITKKFNEFQTAYSKPATDRQRLNLLNGIIGEYRTALTEIENAEKANLNFSAAQTKTVADYKTYYTKVSGILDGMLSRLKTESGQAAQAAPELDKMNADNKVILAGITAIQNEFRASSDPKRRRELLESAKAAFQKALANTQNTQRQNPNLSDSDKQVIARVIEGLTQRIKQLDATLSQMPQ